MLCKVHHIDHMEDSAERLVFCKMPVHGFCLKSLLKSIFFGKKKHFMGKTICAWWGRGPPSLRNKSANKFVTP